MGKKSTFSSDEKALMFTNKAQSSSMVQCFVMGLIMAAIPMYYYKYIVQVSLQDNIVFFAVGTVLSAALLAYSYSFASFKLRAELQRKHEKAARETVRKAVGRGDIEQRVHNEAAALARNEGDLKAMFGNNATYLFILLTTSLYIFPNFSGSLNYTLSTLIAASLTFLFSTGTK